LLAEIVSATTLVLTLLIIARALLSWFPNIDPSNPAVEFLFTVTEPILAPIRAVMPRLGFLDLTPMVAIILLNVIGRVLVQALA
jgi:YggT family protein